MASRKTHILSGTLLWAIAFIIYYFVGGKYFEVSLQREGLWIVLSLLTCQLGAQMPDYDVLWQTIMPHRHFMSHSIVFPMVVSIPIIFVKPDTLIYVPLYAFCRPGGDGFVRRAATEH